MTHIHQVYDNMSNILLLRDNGENQKDLNITQALQQKLRGVYEGYTIK